MRHLKKPAMIGHAVPRSLIALKLPLVAAPRGWEQVSASVVTFPKTASLIFWHCFLFIPCEVSYLHHLETKYEKLPAMRGDKDSFLEIFHWSKRLRHFAIPSSLTPCRRSCPWIRILSNTRERRIEIFLAEISLESAIVAPNLIRRFIAC